MNYVRQTLRIFKIYFGEFFQIGQTPDTIWRYTILIFGTGERKDGFLPVKGFPVQGKAHAFTEKEVMRKYISKRETDESETIRDGRVQFLSFLLHGNNFNFTLYKNKCIIIS